MDALQRRYQIILKRNGHLADTLRSLSGSVVDPVMKRQVELLLEVSTFILFHTRAHVLTQRPDIFPCI